MESNQRYYWRRATEELTAAARAVTPAARLRRRQLAEIYVRKLRELPNNRLASLTPTPGRFRTRLERDMTNLANAMPEWPLPRSHAMPQNNNEPAPPVPEWMLQEAAE